MPEVDFFTILFSTVLGTFFYAIWYSPILFGKKQPLKILTVNYLLAFASSLSISYFLALAEIYLGATYFSDGLMMGFCAWIGFVLPTHLLKVLQTNSKNFKSFCIDMSFWLATLSLMGSVLAG